MNQIVHFDKLWYLAWAWPPSLNSGVERKGVENTQFNQKLDFS